MMTYIEKLNMWAYEDYRRYYENISILNQPTHQLLLGNKLINQLGVFKQTTTMLIKILQSVYYLLVKYSKALTRVDIIRMWEVITSNYI